MGTLLVIVDNRKIRVFSVCIYRYTLNSEHCVYAYNVYNILYYILNFNNIYSENLLWSYSI